MDTMTAASSKTIQRIIKILSILSACIAASVAFICFHTDAKTIVLLIVFLIFYVLLPGCLIINRIGLKSDYVSSTLSRSFFAGFALNITIYYLTSITGLGFLLIIIGPLMSILWLVRIHNDKGLHSFLRDFIGAIDDTPASVFIFAALVFLSSMFATQYSYIPPEFTKFSYIKLDFAYHAGIINALSSGFPPQDPWVDGYTIYYHYYSEMLLSIPMTIFGLTSEKLLMMGTPYLIAPVLTMSLYSFFREYSGRKELSGLYCLIFHFSNMMILKNAHDSWFLYHIYSNINNTGLGVSCMLTAMVLLKSWDNSPNKSRYNTKEMLFFAILIMLMTGIKGPVALTLVGGMAGTYLLALVLRSADKDMLAVTALSVISFVLIYVFVLAAQHDNASGDSAFNLGEVTDIFYLKDSIMNFASIHGMSQLVSWLILFAIFIIFFLSAFIVPFIIGYAREFILIVSKKKPFIFSDVVIYATWMVGFLGVMILDFSGHSQVYFGFAACMLTPIIALRFLEDMHEKSMLAFKLIGITFMICLLVFSISTFRYASTCMSEAKDCYSSDGSDMEIYRSVSAKEYEGLIWLRDNADKNALIASDRFNSVSMDNYQVRRRSNNTHFAYAVYSQRSQYLEGSGFSLELDSDLLVREQMFKTLQRLYAGSDSDRGELARSLGIDYVVVSKRFNDVKPFKSDTFLLCFSNADMDIYEVKDAD